MGQIILYPILTIFVLLFFGYGLTNIFIPSKLKPYGFWISPWFAIIFIIFSFVILSFLGFSIKLYSTIVIPLLMFLNLFVFIKKDKFQIYLSKQDLIIFIFIIINIIFNLSPLIRRDKIMTSVSLGNNDVIAYAATADYFINHSLLESFATIRSPSNAQHAGSADLILGLYRWGEGIITGFLLNIFHLQGYQYVYILQVVLFALTIPLLYLIFKFIYKPSFYGMILILIITGFNVNLLYILYHDFFGQVLYWGLQLFIILFIISYFTSEKNMTSKYNAYDLIIGTALAVLCFSYHEAMVFIIAPLLVYLVIRLSLRKNFSLYWGSIVKILLTTGLTSSYVIFMAFIKDYSQTFGANHNQPIGWQLFRQRIPFANPFEIMGFYSIHSFEPLPNIVAIILSILIIFLIIKGILKSRTRILLTCFIFVYILFFIGTGIFDHNFFTYNRAVTYSLFLFLPLFTIGMIELFNEKKYLKIFFLFLIIGLEMFSAVKLNKRFITERVSVDQALISIKDISKIKIKEPIFMESYLDNGFPYWRQIWQYYFLYFNNPNPLVNPPSTVTSKINIADNSLVLISKSTPWFVPPQLLLKNIIWENEYYKLGRLCNSDNCLINREEDLSVIKMGKNHYEDSLLISGWGIKEPDNRWAVGKESSLRLVAKNLDYTKLAIEGASLKEPQELSIFIDDIFIGKQKITSNMQEYDYYFQKPLLAGVHKITFKYSNVYRPVDIGLSQDMRELSVNFKKVAFEK